MKNLGVIYIHKESGILLISQQVYNRILDFETESLESYKLSFKTENAANKYLKDNFEYVGVLNE